ncbi:hypothetical protein SBDP1_1090037 [Syntrophobacter sp. SbD1]|nr:hypothetical protein SBDP1_1090037 [Syntrophobacter sp. SbD1]
MKLPGANLNLVVPEAIFSREAAKSRRKTTAISPYRWYQYIYRKVAFFHFRVLA